VSNGENSFWGMAVEYLPTQENAKGQAEKKGRVDYRSFSLASAALPAMACLAVWSAFPRRTVGTSGNPEPETCERLHPF